MTHNWKPSSNVVHGKSSIYPEAEKDLAVVTVPYASIASIVIEHRAWLVEITGNCVYRIAVIVLNMRQRIGHYEKDMGVGAEQINLF